MNNYTMSPYPITNAKVPFYNVNGSLANIDNSHPGDLPFASSTYPNGTNTMPPAGSKIQGAASIYPCAQKGGKKYKRKTTKSRSRSKSYKKSKKSNHYLKTHTKRKNKKRVMKGGNYSQFNNNKILSTTYSTAGFLSPNNSALANPVPFTKLGPQEVDNLNHSQPNYYGNYGSGMGFPSKGWY
jgi:hypothetical protein